METDQVQIKQVVIYNLVGTLIHPFVVPQEYEDELSRLRQQGKTGYKNYDTKSAELLRKGDIGVQSIDGAVEILQRIHEGRHANAIYSHSSEERLNLVFKMLGWGKLIDANYGTLDRSEIYDKENPISYKNLARIMQQDGLSPECYVTHKYQEHAAAMESMRTYRVDSKSPINLKEYYDEFDLRDTIRQSFRWVTGSTPSRLI